MTEKIIAFLESVKHIPNWDREPSICDKDLEEMIIFLKNS